MSLLMLSLSDPGRRKGVQLKNTFKSESSFIQCLRPPPRARARCWDMKTHQALSLSGGCPEHGSEARQTGASARRGTDAMPGEDRVEARYKFSQVSGERQLSAGYVRSCELDALFTSSDPER